MASNTAAHAKGGLWEVCVTIEGHVQGVFLRRTIVDWARELGVRGYVHNEDDGTVSVCAQGSRLSLETLLARCYIGSERARVTNVQAEWYEPVEYYSSFEIK